MSFSKKNLIQLLEVAVKHNASDIHLRTDESPVLRIQGEMVPVQSRTINLEDMSEVVKIIQELDDCPTRIQHHLVENEIDGGFSIENLIRTRYNIFRYNGRIGIIMRLVKMSIPSLDELHFSKTFKEISNQRRGLVLVTGATGSGKSTTLAAMINYINATRKCHIITIEDPIEYLHSQNISRVTQREVGRDTNSYTDALKAALRQDPDVILVGEMRDPETISIALKAAETGHLVLSTVHTTNALSTIGRIISMFPSTEQKDVRKRLAVNLYATISQRMLKKADSKGIVIAQEIMLTDPGIKECIRGDEPLERIMKIIKGGIDGAKNGSHTFDQHITKLFKDGVITKETALEATSSQSDFIQQLLVE